MIDYDRALAMLKALIDHEAEAADPYYLREVVEDVLGMTREEAEELGVGYVFDETDDEEW